MTKLVFPKMLAKKRGIVVNISSGSTVHPMQMATVVTATKVSIITEIFLSLAMAIAKSVKYCRVSLRLI